MPLDDKTFIWAVKCLSGEISRDMRMVVLQLDGLSAKFRYYLDREPNDFTRERAEIIAVNFDSGLSYALNHLDIELVYSTEPLGRLHNLDVVLFRRWENDAGDTTPDE